VVQPERQEAQLALLEEQRYYYKEVAVPAVPNQLLELQLEAHQLEPRELQVELAALAVLAEVALAVLAEVALVVIVVTGVMAAQEQLTVPQVVVAVAAAELGLLEQLQVLQVLGVV
jgi:hypothetical protein